ncbi:MAG: DUF1311 domain-containing protein [Candidatus Saccharibacteria bacterium]|nr:DUF1311 domain-containing protein [Moraxellaceae bacterium]
MKKSWGIIFSAAAISLTSCSQFTNPAVECGSEESKNLVIQVFKDELNKKSLAQLKELLKEGITGIDVAKVRALNQQMNFSIADVRTNHNDAQSKKKLCVGTFNAELTPETIQTANESRALVNESSLQDFALVGDVPFENTKLSYDVEYSIQPTDDGQKIYTQVSNSELAVTFLNQVFLDVLSKPARQNIQIQQLQESEQQAQLAAQETAQAEEAAQQLKNDQQAYAQLQINEAQAKLDQSNEKINLVWNAFSKDIRGKLLSDQKGWLKKRELECRLTSVGAENKEIARLGCEQRLTEQRTVELKRVLDSAQTDQ